MILQKRLAADIFDCGVSRVCIDPTRLEEIKKAVTRYDVRKLIDQGAINKKTTSFHSRYWARENKAQKRKSRRKGHGSRKGSPNSRNNTKKMWMATVRLQRDLIHRLKQSNKITPKEARGLYLKSKGGFFRNLRHLKLYLQEQNLVKKL
ncbi:MAG: 50S ribosomal protein L19e [Candidatus Woesearchaeota archaeon]|nr:50S ribosomal protein L19e [Candidatus Woesearchaeota archaeon]